MPAGLCWRRLAGVPFYHHLWRLRLWRTLTGQAAAIALAIFGAGAVEGSPRRGACPTGGLALTWRRRIALRQYFQQKNHVPGDPPANHIAGGVERIDPGAAVYVCLLWLIDGPQLMLASLRQIDMLTVLSLLYLAFIATLVGYGIWGSLLGRYETWRVAPLSLLVPVVGMASALRCCWGRR